MVWSSLLDMVMITNGDHVSSQESPGETALHGQEHFVEAELLFLVQTHQFTVSLSLYFFICHEVNNYPHPVMSLAGR